MSDKEDPKDVNPHKPVDVPRRPADDPQPLGDDEPGGGQTSGGGKAPDPPPPPPENP